MLLSSCSANCCYLLAHFEAGECGAGRASNSPRSSSYGEDPRALPPIPDQLNALGLAPIPEDGLASLGRLA